MKTSFVFLFATTLCLGTGIAGAAGPHAPLRPIGECLVSRNVMDWGVVDNRRLVVKTLGSRYYDIQLSHSCRDLNRRPFLSFRDGMQQLPLGSGRGWRRGIGSDPVTSDGRICGDLGDSVIPHSALWTGTEIPCRISSVRRIDRRAFDGVFGKSSEEARRMLDSSPTVQRTTASR